MLVGNRKTKSTNLVAIVPRMWRITAIMMIIIITMLLLASTKTVVYTCQQGVLLSETSTLEGEIPPSHTETRVIAQGGCFFQVRWFDGQYISLLSN